MIDPGVITIMYLNPAGYIGGAEKSLLDLVERLPRDRYRPLVVSLGPGPLGEEARKRGTEFEAAYLPRLIREASRRRSVVSLARLAAVPVLILPVLVRLLELTRRYRIGIIHTNGLKAHLIGCLLKLLSGHRLVWHFRDLPGGVYLGVFRAFARFFPDRIIANSARVKERLGNADKIIVVYNGIEISAFACRKSPQTFRRGLGWGEKDVVIGSLGHFAPLKGYEDLVRAAPEVLAAVPNAKFVIVGEALYPAWRDYRRRIGDLIESLGLQGRMVCAGGRDDLPDVLPSLDLFVLASRSEGFGRGNLEAMAASKPVVSTRVGGIPEVVVDGETGLLVPPGDPPALAGAIIRLAADPALREKMGSAGRKRAELFSVERMVEGVVGVYGEIGSSKR